MPGETLRLSNVAPHRDHHAAYVVPQPRQASGIAHDHDFHEVMWVVAGSGTHVVAGRPIPLAAGDLVLVRPGDRHRIEAPAPRRLEFVNVAFRSEVWRSFAALAGHSATAGSWDEAETPPLVHVGEPARSHFTAEVDRFLRVDDRSGDLLELLRYLGGVVRLLAPEPPPADLDGGADEPGWLSDACRAIREPANLQRGFRRLVRLSGVSEGHLARSFRRYRGTTPVEFITELRLRRAAALLEVTSAPVGDVALEVGFDNLSYFHRLFRRRFGSTPRAFRLGASRRLIP